jgi:uncharacterized protein YggU (UPF0235/DUF167 family)
MGRLRLKVVPGSSRDEVVGWLDDVIKVKVKVKAPPEKRRASRSTGMSMPSEALLSRIISS